MYKQKISIVILAKNEEKNISRCLESVKNIADEIIVLDESSTDKTEEICQNYKVKVIKNKNSEDFGAARNKGMEAAKNRWVFFIDADEEFIGDLPEFREAENEHVVSFRIRRFDKIWGQEIEYGENGRWSEIRIVDRKSGFWSGKVHEVFKTNGVIASSSSCFLRHFPHQTMSEFISEINHYSSLRSHELHDRKTPVRILDLFMFPLAKFMKNYFFLFGFLDGVQGFIIASLMSFYSFLVRSKLYILNRDLKQRDDKI